MWTDYFNFVKLVPGRVVIPRHGTVDFSNKKLPLEFVKAIYDSGSPYLELTEKGMDKYCPKPKKKRTKEIEKDI